MLSCKNIGIHRIRREAGRVAGNRTGILVTFLSPFHSIEYLTVKGVLFWIEKSLMLACRLFSATLKESDGSTCCDAEIRRQPQPQPDTETSPQPPQQTMMVAAWLMYRGRDGSSPTITRRGVSDGNNFPGSGSSVHGYQGGMNR